MYDFLQDANLYDDKPIGDWGEAEFRSIFESVQRIFGADIAWQLLYRLIQLRAGEINEVQFNGAGNPLEAMSVGPDRPDDDNMQSFFDGLMEEILDSGMSDMDPSELEALFGEDYEEVFEDFEEEYDEDDDEEDDEDDPDDEDYRDKYGNAGRFF